MKRLINEAAKYLKYMETLEAEWSNTLTNISTSLIKRLEVGSQKQWEIQCDCRDIYSAKYRKAKDLEWDANDLIENLRFQGNRIYQNYDNERNVRLNLTTTITTK